MGKRSVKEYGWSPSDRVLVPTPDRKDSVEKYIRTYEMEVVVQSKTRSFFIDVYSMKYVDEKMKGYNYSIEAVLLYPRAGSTAYYPGAEIERMISFYDYYKSTGNYFKTFEEAKKNAIKMALKMKFPTTNKRIKVLRRTTISKWKKKDKEVNIDGKKKIIPVYRRIIHPFWYVFDDGSDLSEGTITLYITVEPTKNSGYKLWHYTIEALTDKRVPEEKRREIGFLDSERDKQLTFKTSTEARKAVMKEWDKWLHSKKTEGIKPWTKMVIRIDQKT